MQSSKKLLIILSLIFGILIISGCFSFEVERHDLDLVIEGEGSVEVNNRVVDGERVMAFDANSTVDLEPVPDEEWMFLEWGGLDRNFVISKDSGVDSILMDGDKELVAKFVRKLITVESDERLLEPGEEKQLEYIVEEEGTEVSFSSDDENVAIIDDEGNIEAVNKGHTYIKVVAEYGEERIEINVEVIVDEKPNFVFDYSLMGGDGNIYFADNTNNELKYWDTEEETMQSVASFDNSISSMVGEDNFIYLSEDVRVWEYDISEREIEHKYNAGGNINSLYYTGDYIIINDDTGAWSNNILIRLSDFERLDSNDWVKPSMTYVHLQEQERVYTLNDGTSPDDLNYQEYDSDVEEFGEDQGSPYHGDYSLSHPLKQFTDELKVMVSTGNIFDVSDGGIEYHSNLGYSYEDVVFYDDKIYVLNNNDGDTRLLVLEQEEPYSRISTPYEFEDRVGKRLFIDGEKLIVITQEYEGRLSFDPPEGRIFIDEHDIDDLN